MALRTKHENRIKREEAEKVEQQRQNAETELRERTAKAKVLPQIERDRLCSVWKKSGDPAIPDELVDYIDDESDFLGWLMKYANLQEEPMNLTKYYTQKAKAVQETFQQLVANPFAYNSTNLETLRQAVALLFANNFWLVAPSRKYKPGITLEGEPILITSEELTDSNPVHLGADFFLFTPEACVGAILISSGLKNEQQTLLEGLCSDYLQHSEDVQFIVFLLDKSVKFITAVASYEKFIFPTPENYIQVISALDYVYNQGLAKVNSLRSELSKEKGTTASLQEELLLVKNQTPSSEITLEGFQQMFDMMIQLQEGQKNLSNKMDTYHEEDTKRFDSIDQQLQAITEKLNSQVCDYKKMASALLDNISDEIQQESIIGAFSGLVESSIIEGYQSNAIEKSFIQKEEELKQLFKGFWDNKMSEETKRCLISARLMFDNLSPLGEKADYSGVCILTTKALERELSKRFYQPFLDYIERTDKNLALKDYPAGLTNKNNKGELQINPPEQFTFGSLATLFSHVAKSPTANHTRLLTHYCYQELFIREHRRLSFIEDYLKSLYFSVSDLNDNYRNPSAHVSYTVSMNDAEKCYDVVVREEAVLKCFLEKCDY